MQKRWRQTSRSVSQMAVRRSGKVATRLPKTLLKPVWFQQRQKDAKRPPLLSIQAVAAVASEVELEVQEVAMEMEVMAEIAEDGMVVLAVALLLD